MVRGRSSAQRLRESAQAVKVVDVREARRQTADTGEILGRTEGVAVQRTGGLGSSTRLSLHGLTDDQIRTYVDGVPLEASGFGLGISTVPLGWIERIDIYRGVVPLRLGSDALGGAVDLITEQPRPVTAATASYAGGAFGTHQISLDARTRPHSSGLVARGAAFYDTARNDYQVDVRVPDEVGRLRPARVRRFHDGFRAAGGMFETGFADRWWARRLLLRVHATDFAKDLQHNIDMTVPYGGAEYGQRALGGLLRYEQPRLASRSLTVAAHAGYSRRWLHFRDVSRWVHDWSGNQIFERAAGSGELSAFASDLTQGEHRVLGRASLTWQPAPGRVARLMVAPDLVWRTGAERLRVNPARIDPLTTRREIFQLVSGAELELRDDADRLENGTFAKLYLYRPSSDQVRTFDNSIRHIEDQIHRLGFGDVLRARLVRGLFAKLSYEYATRLPRPDEVFGDGSLVLPNLLLMPESSHNANLGSLIERRLGPGGGTLAAEATAFLRWTRDMVVLLLAQDRIHSLNQNVFNVRTLGADGMLRWLSPEGRVALQANATWQEQRNDSGSGPFAPFSGQRVPNRPWLFANASAVLHLGAARADGSGLSVSWISRYVHGFLPGWEETSAPGDARRVPAQLTHSAGAVYSFRRAAYTLDLALDVSNLTNQAVYDVLGVQKPGRAAFVKATVGWKALDPDAAHLN